MLITRLMFIVEEKLLFNLLQIKTILCKLITLNHVNLGDLLCSIIVLSSY